MKRMSGEKDQSRAAGGPALEVRALELGSTVKPGGNGETLEVRRCKRNEEPPVCRCSGGGVERLAVDGGGREMVRVLGTSVQGVGPRGTVGVALLRPLWAVACVTPALTLIAVAGRSCLRQSVNCRLRCYSGRRPLQSLSFFAWQSGRGPPLPPGLS